MKVGILFSGGKDSTMTLNWVIKQGHTPSCLITLKSRREDSYMFHVPNIDLVKQQSEALGIPLIFEQTSGIKESELEDLKRAVKLAVSKYKIEALAAGALASQYQKERVEKIAAKYNLKVFAPYWHADPETYLKEIISECFEVIVTAIAADGLNKSWLGRKIDDSFLSDIKKLNVHLAGEGGEYETFVLDGPIFKKSLSIDSSEKVMTGKNQGTLNIRSLNILKGIRFRT